MDSDNWDTWSITVDGHTTIIREKKPRPKKIEQLELVTVDRDGWTIGDRTALPDGRIGTIIQIGDLLATVKPIVGEITLVKINDLRRPAPAPHLNNPDYIPNPDELGSRIIHFHKKGGTQAEDTKTTIAVREQDLTPNWQGNGYLEIKTIKGKQYKYWRYRANGKLKSKYLGRL